MKLTFDLIVSIKKLDTEAGVKGSLVLYNKGNRRGLRESLV